MKKDLVVLVADKDAKLGLNAMLSRYESLNIRIISYDIFSHPLRDPGVYNGAIEFLRPFLGEYEYAIVFLDREGSGQEDKSVDEIANKIKTELENNGWQNRVEVIIFDPELEIWLWTDSLHTADVLGWSNYSELKKWLVDHGLWQQNLPKPERPKETMEKALREKRMPYSSSIYQEIAQKVTLEKCQDNSFIKLRHVLQQWFPKIQTALFNAELRQLSRAEESHLEKEFQDYDKLYPHE